MRVPKAICVLLLILALKVTCQEEKSPPEWVTAVPGVCAVILCTFANSEKQSFTKETWGNCSDCQISSGPKDIGNRLSLLELDSSKKNCCMIIKQIEGQDEGYYQFRLQTRSENVSCASVNITIQDKPMMSVPPLTFKEQTKLSCSAPDPCPSARPNMTWWIKKQGQNITTLSGGNSSQSLTHSSGTITSVLTFLPSLDQHDAEVVCVVSYGNDTTINMTSTLKINYLMDPRISGNNTVKEGDTLRLNCSVNSSSPLLNITWSFRGALIQSNTTQDTLTITNFNSEHAGEYVCTVHNFNKTLTTSVNITVSYPPRILNESECVRPDNYLECKCNCNGVPLPHVVWPKEILNSYHHHIEGYPNGSAIYSTLRLHRPNLQILPAEMKCMCENSAGNDERSLDIQKKSPDGIKLDLRTILTFFVGAAATAIIVCIALCFVGICMRCGRVKAVDGNADRAGVKLETVKIQHDPNVTQADADQTEDDEHTPLQRCPAVGFTGTAAVNCKNEEEDTPGEDRPSGEEEVAGEKEQREVDYACIDYSLLQGRGAEAQKTQTEETEYAEIQIKKQAEGEGPEPLQVVEVHDEAQELENQEQVEVEEAEV